MPIYVEKLEDEPIIFLTLQAPLRLPEEMRSAIDEIAHMIEQFYGIYYRIVDVSDPDIRFNDIVMAIAESAKGKPGSMTDPRARNVYVGDGEIVDLLAGSPLHKQYNSREAYQFPTMDKALSYVRSALIRKTDG